MIGYGFTRYKAPKGYVYDYKEPRYITIDGEQIEEHLYAKYLVVSRQDDIKNYKLVKDPKENSDATTN